MLKHILIISCVGGVVTSISAQGYFRNTGLNVRNVGSTSKMRLKQTNFISTGATHNAGTIAVGGNFTQSGAGSYAATATSSLLFNGTANQTIQSATAIDLATLQVDNGNRLVLASNIDATSGIDLNLNGSIELGNFNLNVGNGDIVNGSTTDYIITNGTGVVQQTMLAGDIKEFPVGNASYAPVILLSNSGATDVFSVRVTNQILTNGTSGTAETADNVGLSWFISEAVVGGNNVDISVEWAAANELTSFDRASCGIKHWNGSSWDLPATYSAAVASSGRYSQAVSGQTSFSPFGVVDNSQTFPIELTHFKADRTSAYTVKLNWATASETNNAGFDVERMLDTETSFSRIQFVAGHGTTTEARSYQLVDNNAHTGVSYYRLLQRDSDGTSSYSNMIAVFGSGSIDETLIYPNPVHDVLYIRKELAQPEFALMQIIDLQGKVVWESMQKLYSGQTFELTSVANLPPSLYTLRVRITKLNEVFTYKFQKK